MLFNPKWKKEAKAVVRYEFGTTEDLADWLATKDPNEVYDFRDGTAVYTVGCCLYQYAKERGTQHGKVTSVGSYGLSFIKKARWFKKREWFHMNMDRKTTPYIVAGELDPNEWSFGQALNRAKEVLSGRVPYAV